MGIASLTTSSFFRTRILVSFAFVTKVIRSVGKLTSSRLSFSEIGSSIDIFIRSRSFTTLEIKPYGNVGTGDATSKTVCSALSRRLSM